MSIDLRMLDSSDGLSPPSSPRASGGTLFNPSSPVVTAASSTAFAASPVSSLPWSIPVFSSSASGSARSNPGPNQERDTQVTPASTQPSTPGRATGASSSTRVLSHSSSLFAVSYPSSSSSPVTVDPIPGLVVNGARGAKKASEKRPRSVSAPPVPVPTSEGAPIIGPTGTEAWKKSRKSGPPNPLSATVLQSTAPLGSRTTTPVKIPSIRRTSTPAKTPTAKSQDSRARVADVDDNLDGRSAASVPRERKNLTRGLMQRALAEFRTWWSVEENVRDAVESILEGFISSGSLFGEHRISWYSSVRALVDPLSEIITEYFEAAMDDASKVALENANERDEALRKILSSYLRDNMISSWDQNATLFCSLHEFSVIEKARKDGRGFSNYHEGPMELSLLRVYLYKAVEGFFLAKLREFMNERWDFLKDQQYRQRPVSDNHLAEAAKPTDAEIEEGISRIGGWALVSALDRMVHMTARAQVAKETSMSVMVTSTLKAEIMASMCTTIPADAFNTSLTRGKLTFLTPRALQIGRKLFATMDIDLRLKASNPDFAANAKARLEKISKTLARDFIKVLADASESISLHDDTAAAILLEWGLKMMHCLVGEAIRNKTRETSASNKTALLTSLKVEHAAKVRK